GGGSGSGVSDIPRTMTVEYSPRAVSDLRKVSLGSRAFGEAVSAAVEARIREVVARIAQAPESARRLVGRPTVRVVPLVRYPYKIFYTVATQTVQILHVRHTARRPWKGERA